MPYCRRFVGWFVARLRLKSRSRTFAVCVWITTVTGLVSYGWVLTVLGSSLLQFALLAARIAVPIYTVGSTCDCWMQRRCLLPLPVVFTTVPAGFVLVGKKVASLYYVLRRWLFLPGSAIYAPCGCRLRERRVTALLTRRTHARGLVRCQRLLRFGLTFLYVAVGSAAIVGWFVGYLVSCTRACCCYCLCRLPRCRPSILLRVIVAITRQRDLLRRCRAGVVG